MKIVILLLIFVILLFTGGADTVTFEQASNISEVGFWHGFWHGLVLPFAWLISLFDSDVAIYAIYNNGGWYDFGYMLGVGGIGFGSGILR